MLRLTAMSAAAGWYPDPAGQPGMYRYWDGRSWSAAVSPGKLSYPTLGPPWSSPAPEDRVASAAVGCLRPATAAFHLRKDSDLLR